VKKRTAFYKNLINVLFALDLPENLNKMPQNRLQDILIIIKMAKIIRG
jgi:hypothetical protein